ncbi:MAG: Protein kinase OspG [Pseudomonas sp.]|nr:MAG: Protein kinase OspG [Pseudomonas sp.]
MTGITSARLHVAPPLLSDHVQPPPAADNAGDQQAEPLRLGDFGGALSWPVPLGKAERSLIISLMQEASAAVPGLPEADWSTRSDALGKLLNSPKAQALGQAIQTKLGGFPGHSSVSDYVLAALQLGLDPESHENPTANSVAGFDLAQAAHSGNPASAVIDGLSRHLIEKGRATPTTANLAASLLLARTAPEFLVKDIPPSVTYGSITWAQLAIATARLEADSPGQTLTMSYAQVLASAEVLSGDDAGLQLAQRKALADWGVVNGWLDRGAAVPTDTQMEPVRTAYNNQLRALTAASEALQVAIPGRREMALAALQEAFPTTDARLFEAKALQKVWLNPGRPGAFPGLYSMLDIVMEGGTLGDREHWTSRDTRIPAARFCQLYETGKLKVAAAFNAQYEQAITSLEAGHAGLAKYLISTLPPQDRANFEYGELAFFHTNQYSMAMDFFTPQALHSRGHTLHVKTIRGGEVNVYELDTRNATVRKQNYLISRYTPPYTAQKLESRNANIVSKTVVFNPFGSEQPDPNAARPQPAVRRQGEDDSRSDYIAKVFAKSLDLHTDDLLAEARGVTAYEEIRATNAAIGEFFLNLIPLRSAIVNFSRGNYTEGAVDLVLDVVGLVSMGAGKAAQAGKAFSKGITTISGLARAARFIGVSLIEAFNPLSGLGDLVVGGAGLINSGGRLLFSKSLAGVNKLRGANASYDLLKAASKQHGVTATGTFKMAGQTAESGAVLHNGQWYAFDADKMQPYGSPLEAFVARTRAVNGVIATPLPAYELSNTLHGTYKVADANITGLSRNSQGVYVAADGHLSHIRHTDSTGQTAVYEVRQVSRTEDGAVQAHVYYNNRQTGLLVEHVQGDQWQRVIARGGNRPSVASDLGPKIGQGGEGIVYESLDGNSVYKDFGTKNRTVLPDYVTAETRCLNTYYGEGFAVAILEEGRSYIKMKKLDGVCLEDVPKRSLPMQARVLLDEALAGMEAKGIYHNDLQLKNFLYSARDNKVYPVDIQSLPPEVLADDVFLRDMTLTDYQRHKTKLQHEFDELVLAAG